MKKVLLALPKPHSTEMTEKKYEVVPLFIEVFKGEEEAENWQENFEVKSCEKIAPNF